jgi:hypothetical protein
MKQALARTWRYVRRQSRYTVLSSPQGRWGLSYFTCWEEDIDLLAPVVGPARANLIRGISGRNRIPDPLSGRNLGVDETEASAIGREHRPPGVPGIHGCVCLGQSVSLHALDGDVTPET